MISTSDIDRLWDLHETLLDSLLVEDQRDGVALYNILNFYEEYINKEGKKSQE